jgi:gluconokinase
LFGVVVIVFGVSGAGKTTVGKLLAHELGWRFCEADDFHSQGNIRKMRRGVPLTEEDRKPWLERLRGVIRQSVGAGENMVLACSALKKSYRDYLRVSPKVSLIYLRGDYALIDNQLRRRRGHFMNPGLLGSQLADLEEPEPEEGALVIELGRSPIELVEEIRAKLNLL